MTQKELNEEKKLYLTGYGRILRRIAALEDQLKSLEELAETAKAIEYSGSRSRNKKRYDLSDIIIQIESLKEEISEMIKIQYERRVKIEREASRMENGDELQIIRKKYIEMKDWETIGDELGTSKRNVQRWHGSALTNFEMEV